MSLDTAEFRELMEYVQKGDNDAAARLLRIYGDTVIAHIRACLKRCRVLRAEFDTDDFAQGVWGDFLTGPARHRMFTTPAEFVSYLVGMARYQVSRAARDRLGTKKRDRRRRRHLSDPAVSDEVAAVVDPSPSPDRFAASDEAWDNWLRSLTADEQKLVLLRRAGLSYAQIAREFGCSGRTVERMVADIRRQHSPAPVTNL